MDPVGTLESAGRLVGRFGEVRRWFAKRKHLRTSDNLGRRQAGPVETYPQLLEIDLTRDPPSVEVTLRLINYSRSTVDVRGLTVTRVGLGSASIDRVPMFQSVSIPPLSSFGVHCQRALVDSEARQIGNSDNPAFLNAGANIEGFGHLLGKDFTISASGLAVRGFLRRAAV